MLNHTPMAGGKSGQMKGDTKMRFFYTNGQMPKYVVHLYVSVADDHYYFNDFVDSEKFFKELCEKYSLKNSVVIRLCSVVRLNEVIAEYRNRGVDYEKV